MQIIESNAKINWTLNVMHKRSDGYHELQSIMQQISLCDIIKIEQTKKQFSFYSSDKALEEIKNNTLIVATKLYCQQTGVEMPQISVFLEKNIPSQAGLGGGSSNAAAMLRYLNNIYKKISNKQLCELAAKIGADVPFFLSNSSIALCKGIGDQTLPLKPEKYWLLLVKAKEGVSTPSLFKSLNLNPKQQSHELVVSDNELMVKGLETRNYNIIFSQNKNALETKAIEQVFEIQKILETLQKTQSIVSCCMSGSGSCCYGVFQTQKDAQKAKSCFSEEYFLCVCQTV